MVVAALPLIAHRRRIQVSRLAVGAQLVMLLAEIVDDEHVPVRAQLIQALRVAPEPGEHLLGDHGVHIAQPACQTGLRQMGVLALPAVLVCVELVHRPVPDALVRRALLQLRCRPLSGATFHAEYNTRLRVHNCRITHLCALRYMCVESTLPHQLQRGQLHCPPLSRAAYANILG